MGNREEAAETGGPSRYHCQHYANLALDGQAMRSADIMANPVTQRGTFRMGVAGSGGPRSPIFQLLSSNGAPSLVAVSVVRPTSGSIAVLDYIRTG